MADAVTSQTLSDGDRIAVVKYTNISDGTGESSVKKVDISTFAASVTTGATPARATIEQIWYDIAGMRVALEWNATTNVVAAVLGTSLGVGTNVSGHMDFRSVAIFPPFQGWGHYTPLPSLFIYYDAKANVPVT